jgi:hypothetical protein
LTIPEQIKVICQEIDACYSKNVVAEERVITRQTILKLAMKHADYCNNGKTSKHSDYEFLRWIGRGKYLLNSSH